MIKIARYKKTRHWAVWMKDELVAVVCYITDDKECGASASSGSSPLVDRRGLALPAVAAASDFNAHPSTPE